ncbi:hypothetical protein [Actinoplanes derwentensis]|uniref:Uncharacterized protein n=1 Tax=Actinoplanes derwentensis TaxID=113562 RepID=A0A1H2C766_9ACTN|nr:hypothetical protein [Actinoplanes derwentensis]GID84264.1 hypothetical protein Ade03nite_31880 [Actinoplanes derwentensis]SDT66231.1 hypothetical protein SAMN04489716_5328 [Actinoplanes derwentensis]
MRGEDEMNDDGAVRMLQPLREEPAGPPRFDVARAMAEGRRRRGLRRWTGGLALIALTSVTAGGGTLAIAAMQPETPARKPATVTSVAPSTQAAAAPAAAPPPKSCQVALLPTGGVRKSVVTAGDPSGRYQAGRLYDAAENLIVWKNGKIDARLRIPGADASIDDLNQSGVGVGSSYLGESQQAFVYRDGTYSELDGSQTSALAINEAGVIVGALGPFNGEVPVRWTSASAKVERLPLPSGYPVGIAKLIADDGTVVGSVGRGRLTLTAYLWLPDGTGKLMPLPTVGGKKADYFEPTSIAGDWILGAAIIETDDSEGRPSRALTPIKFRISDGTYHPVPATDGIGFGQLADNGWILALNNESYKPVILSGSKVVKLPEYQRFKEYQVTSFSADGKTVGGYSTDMGPEEVDNRPFLWTCK